jgi:exosome complex component CSL4
VVIETLANGVQRYNVLPRGNKGAVSQGISVNDKVLCRVTRIATHQCFVDILSVNDGHPLGNPTAGIPFPKGVVRREDVRLDNVDALVMPDCFRPGDIIRAAVLSLGDTRVYFLSTASEQLGVIRASSSDGGLLEPVSWGEMRDKSTGKIEPRKVAKI